MQRVTESSKNDHSDLSPWNCIGSCHTHLTATKRTPSLQINIECKKNAATTSTPHHSSPTFQTSKESSHITHLPDFPCFVSSFGSQCSTTAMLCVIQSQVLVELKLQLNYVPLYVVPFIDVIGA